MFSFSPLLLFVFLGIALGQDPPMPCGPRGQCPPDTTCENNFCILKVLPPNEKPNESSIGDACGPAQPCSPPFSCINEKCNVQPDGTDVPGGDDTDFGPQCDPNNPNDGICNANEKCIVAQGETVAKCVASNDANVPAITPGPNPNPNPGQGTSQCAHDLDCGAGFRCSLTQGKCVSKGTPIRPVIPIDQWNNRRSGGCVDKHAPGRASDCPQRKYLCEDRLYYDLMTVQCPYTCGRCSSRNDNNNGDVNNGNYGSNGFNGNTNYGNNENNDNFGNSGFNNGFNRGNIRGSNANCFDLTAPGRASDCPQRRHLCNDSRYQAVMQTQCRKTCGLC